MQMAEITSRGVEGDHLYVVRDGPSGRILDLKSHAYSWGETSALPRMVDFRARLRGDVVAITLPDGSVRQRSPSDLDVLFSESLGRPVEVLRYPRIVESRILSRRTLHLLSTSSIATIAKFYPGGGFDVRRFRPNLVISTPIKDGFAEENWIGRTVVIGKDVLIKVEKPNMMCKVTTLRQTPLREDPEILTTLERQNQNKLGVMCSVVNEGSVRVGDALTQEG